MKKMDMNICVSLPSNLYGMNWNQKYFILKHVKYVTLFIHYIKQFLGANSTL